MGLCTQVARRFYLLFQLHSTEELLEADGFWGSNGCAHQLCMLGQRQVLMALDTRSGRTAVAIVPGKDYALLRAQLMALPSSVQHVITLVGVPVLHPELPVQKLLESLNAGKSPAISLIAKAAVSALRCIAYGSASFTQPVWCLGI